MRLLNIALRHSLLRYEPPDNHRRLFLSFKRNCAQNQICHVGARCSWEHQLKDIFLFFLFVPQFLQPSGGLVSSWNVTLPPSAHSLPLTIAIRILAKGIFLSFISSLSPRHPFPCILIFALRLHSMEYSVILIDACIRNICAFTNCAQMIYY